jgi:four helix bundle protein
MDFVERIYKTTSRFPKEELYGLTSQMRRAAVSIPSNISEGAVGRSEAQFANYLTVALGSLSELDTQIELSYRLGYIGREEF